MSGTRKTVSIFFLFASIATTILMYSLTTEEETTISAMQVKYPVLGIIWAVAAAFAVFFNMEWLLKESEIKSKCFRVLVITGSFSVLLTPFTLEESPIGFSLPFINLHRFSAVFFAAVSYIALLTVLISRRSLNRKIYSLLSAVLIAIVLINLCGIFAMDGYVSAFMEMVLMLAGLAALLFMNFAPKKKSEDVRS